MARFCLLALKLVCYLALFAVAASFAVMTAIDWFRLCRWPGTTVACDQLVLQAIADLSLGVVLVTFFTGLPAIVALAGLAFAVADGMAWWRRRRGRKAA